VLRETLLIRVLEDAINRPIKRARSAILGAPHGGYYSYVLPSRGAGNVDDGHKNFDGSAEGDAPLPDHFVAAKLVKGKEIRYKGH